MREPDSHANDVHDYEVWAGFTPDDSDMGAEDRAAEAELQRKLDKEKDDDD